MPTDGDQSDTVVTLDKKFVRAVEEACALHRTQVRKGTKVPYIAHLLGVASLVLEGGGTQREAIAALLHDSLEDTSATPKQIRKRFGRKVARIVVACTDVPVDTSRRKKRKKPKTKQLPPRDAANWRERKLRSIEHLRDPDASESVLRVRAADALYNARAVLADLRRYGPEAWGRFNAGAVDQLWYYRSLSIVLSRRLPGLLSDELRVAVLEMERLAGWWFDIGDPQSGR
jgi:(p)ppGpp synthase/HD superfamily hydrolase